MIPEMNPAVVVALIGFAGVAVGHVISGWNQSRANKESNRLAELTLTVDTMQEEITRLSERVYRLEADLARARTELRVTERKYHAALDWAHALIRVIDGLRGTDGQSGIAVPEPPSLIREDT